jgi:hypothetical protein
VVDQSRAGHIQQLFELYDTGLYSVPRLRMMLFERGLRSRRGRILSRNTLYRLLHTRFYTGTICRRATGQVFAGRHEPILSEEIFERVQRRLAHKRSLRSGRKHCFRFSGQIPCTTCGRRLVGEIQKGHVYYRCHQRRCRGNCLREEAVALSLDSGPFALTHQKPSVKYSHGRLLGNMEPKQRAHQLQRGTCRIP